MLTLQTVLEQMTGHGIVEALEAFLAESFDDFALAQGQYIEAMAALKRALGDNATVLPEEEEDAIRQQTASNLLFSGMLGLKANWAHYSDPVARTFLEVDAELYLQEERAHMLPDYVRAQETRERFYAQLTPTQRALYEDVNDYASYLETAAPKLAHYCGYLLGNALLPRLAPGYHPDQVLTLKYTAMLEAYFNKSLSPIAAPFL